MGIERFKDIDPPAAWRIEAWQLARELTHKVYGLTKKAKFARDFGLKVQGCFSNPKPRTSEPFR